MPIPGRVSHEFLRRLECPVDVPQDFPSKNRSPISSGILPLSVAWFPTSCSTLKEVFRRKIGQSKCIYIYIYTFSAGSDSLCVCSWFHQYFSVLSISGHIFVDQISKLFCSNGDVTFYMSRFLHYLEILHSCKTSPFKQHIDDRSQRGMA